MKLTRRRAMQSALAALPSLAVPMQAQPEQPLPAIESGPFQATRDSLSAYEIPAWFQDAKFGIWAHWGPQSAVEDGDWYARNMYIEGSPQYNYHVETYGHPSKVGFKDLIPAWKAEKFDPDHLLSLYQQAGAKYFLSMAVHHDNFDLWNSRHQKWNAVNMGPKKDIVGLFRQAARNHGLRFGLSDHLWITYKWFSVSHGQDQTGPLAGVRYDGANKENTSLYVDSDEVWSGKDLDWNESGIPEWWKRHWFLRIKDLVDQHQPDLLYTDGHLPFEEHGLRLVAHHYNLSAKRNGGKTESVYTSKRLLDASRGVCVLDVERGIPDAILPYAWQTDTCIGNWHYKRGVEYKTPKIVIDMLVDIVSKNGNLLLNFPLPANGALDLPEQNVLTEITKWMRVNGAALYGTRPWKIFGEGPSIVKAGDSSAFNERNRKEFTAADVRFTTKGSKLYAIVMGAPEYQAVIPSLRMGSPLRISKIQNVELLGFSGKLTWHQDQAALHITMPPQLPSRHAVALEVTGA